MTIISRKAAIVLVFCGFLAQSAATYCAATRGVTPKKSRSGSPRALPESSDGALAPARAKKIRAIIVHGNALVSPKAIRAKMPFAEGDRFQPADAQKAIRAIHGLGYFTHIAIARDDISGDTVDIHVTVVEKKRVQTVTFEGNADFADDKLREAIEASRVKVLDEKELGTLARRIERVYRDKKSRHHVKVTGSLKKAEEGSFTAHFVIDEGNKTWIRKVGARGAKKECLSIPFDYLQKKIFTRPAWIFGFWDRAGTYHPDALMQDKFTVENAYQSNGFFNARVTDTQVNESPDGSMDVVFVIDEGEMYTLGKVEAIGNHLLNDQQLLVRIPLFTGQLYSKDLVREAMEQLRTIWGEFGYIYADVQPIIKPDDKTHTVAITFKTDLGNCIRVNRVDIVGNNKTHDHVIRREILFDEGDILTTRLMDESKRRVMLLGYFDQKDGATWRTIKVDDEHADLELVVKEARTGKIEAQVGYGGQADLSSPTSGISFRTAIHDSNLRGTGTRYNISASYARQDKAFEMMLANDWLFDKPIYGSCDAYLRKLSYEEFNKTVEEPRERDIGGMLRTGFRVERLDYAQVGLALGEEDITYESPNIGRRVSDDPAVQLQFQETINRTFQSGDVLWLGGTMAQDFRDHPIYPSTGVNWLGDMKIGVPHNQHGFAFVKATANLHWYTPLIQDYGVVLHLHGFAGIVHQITQHSIPYRELFHLGGPASVRGFLFGQIGPSLMGSDLGGKKAFFVNAELQIPITADHNFSGVLFYDGGANWDTPNAGAIGKAFLQRNNFEYRHAVGFGLRLENPQPIQIEWGFKLDRKRRRHESAFEVHFGMSRPL